VVRNSIDSISEICFAIEAGETTTLGSSTRQPTGSVMKDSIQDHLNCTKSSGSDRSAFDVALRNLREERGGNSVLAVGSGYVERHGIMTSEPTYLNSGMTLPKTGLPSRLLAYQTRVTGHKKLFGSRLDGFSLFFLQSGSYTIRVWVQRALAHLLSKPASSRFSFTTVFTIMLVPEAGSKHLLPRFVDTRDDFQNVVNSGTIDLLLPGKWTQLKLVVVGINSTNICK
jgi:hypothetical protein